MTKRCLVIGCSGQDGSFLCKSLINKGYKVIGTSRNNKRNINHRIIGIEGKFEIYQLNLSKIDEIKNLIQLIKPDEIYNLSAQSSVGLSYIQPIETQISIVNATFNLLEACRVHNFQGVIFFAGSGEIFGETESPATINCSIDIRNSYALAKLQTFEMVKLYRNIYNVNAVTGILFNHESQLRDEKFVSHKINKSAIESSQDKSKKFKFGNLNIYRDWGWAEEYVEAMQIITRAKKLQDHLICTGRATSLKEFIDKTFKLLNLNWQEHIEIDKNLQRKNDVTKNYGDPQILFEIHKWRAQIDIDKIIEKLLIQKKKRLSNKV